MNARKEFLLALFRNLEQSQVPYCVVRNYDDLYTSTVSDVDLAVEPENVPRFECCLAEAAIVSNHFEALRAAYANLSYVFLHETGALLRIDVETGTRWRIFPILSAKAIVALRRRHDEFYVPHPRHESVVLFTASIWRNSVSPRYRKQLARLYDQLSDPEQLRRTFRSIFGKFGNVLLEYQANASHENPGRLPFRAVKKSLVIQSMRLGPVRRAMLQYFCSDLRRYAWRALHPPGIELVLASSARQPRKIEPLIERMEFLYPAGKTNRRKNRFERLKTLFKGGLFIRYYQAGDERKIGRILARHSLLSYPSRAFVSAENSRGEAAIAHVSSGFMAQLDSSPQESATGIIQFVSKMLNRTQHALDPRGVGMPTRGIVLVLLGLDGSGKTTIARELCCLAGRTHHFPRVRYFHWRPSLGGKALFPFSSTENIPRKPKLQSGMFVSLLSSLRLFKNLALTKLAWTLRIEKMLKNGTLVIMDRYFYNYYLDPASVRYYGAPGLVDKVREGFPQPDLIVILRAPIETLLARKQELSAEEIRNQSAVLEKISREAPSSISVDATRPASEIAREIFSRLAGMRGPEREPLTQRCRHAQPREERKL